MKKLNRKPKFLRRPEVIERTGLSRSTIYSYMTLGKFPRPVRIGARAVAWREEDIDNWMASRGEADPSEVYCRTDTKAARVPNL